jgi:hypothetical protein
VLAHLRIWVRVNEAKERETDRPNLVFAPPWGIVRGVGSLDHRVVHQRIVRVRLRIGQISRVLSDGVLDQDMVRDLIIADLITAREGAYSETVPDTKNLQVDWDTGERSCGNRGVLVEEVSWMMQELE